MLRSSTSMTWKVPEAAAAERDKVVASPQAAENMQLRRDCIGSEPARLRPRGIRGLGLTDLAGPIRKGS
jgi:hypothetical protein